MSTDHVLVLRSNDPPAFMADACAAAAAAIGELRPCGPREVDMINLYAELVVAYARLVRERLSGARVAIVDHLVVGVTQARNGEIATPLVDIIDRLHGEVMAQPVLT